MASAETLCRRGFAVAEKKTRSPIAFSTTPRWPSRTRPAAGAQASRMPSISAATFLFGGPKAGRPSSRSNSGLSAAWSSMLSERAPAPPRNHLRHSDLDVRHLRGRSRSVAGYAISPVPRSVPIVVYGVLGRNEAQKSLSPSWPGEVWDGAPVDAVGRGDDPAIAPPGGSTSVNRTTDTVSGGDDARPVQSCPGTYRGRAGPISPTISSAVGVRQKWIDVQMGRP